MNLTFAVSVNLSLSNLSNDQGETGDQGKRELFLVRFVKSLLVIFILPEKVWQLIFSLDSTLALISFHTRSSFATITFT